MNNKLHKTQSLITEINNTIKEIWELTFEDNDQVRVPLLYTNPSKKTMIFPATFYCFSD